MNMQVLVPRPWNEVMSEGGASASPSRKITCDSWGLNGRPCRGIVKVKHFDTAEAIRMWFVAWQHIVVVEHVSGGFAGNFGF